MLTPRENARYAAICASWFATPVMLTLACIGDSVWTILVAVGVMVTSTIAFGMS